MAEAERKTWRELCKAALEAKDPNELLKIVAELSKALKHEEQVRRVFRETTKAINSSADTNPVAFIALFAVRDGPQTVSMSRPWSALPDTPPFMTS